MATTQNTYTGNGSTTNYSFTFEYLKQADVKVTLDTAATTAFTFANATTLSFTTAPANGVAIRIFRDTPSDTLSSTFFPGSAIKAEDLNENFTQNLYVTQESDAEAGLATTTANGAVTTANNAVTTANGAVTTANSADTKSDAAVATANNADSVANAAAAVSNTANTNSINAVNTANTASTDATTAVNTANAATTTANNAVTSAATANTTAGNAVTTADNAVVLANTAISNAATANTTANGAVTTANNAVTTANSTIATADNAVTTANTAVTTANTANTNASSALTIANAAAADVADSVLYTSVINKAALEALTPTEDGYYQVTDSTGLANGTWTIGTDTYTLSGIPASYPSAGLSGITTKFNYTYSTNTYSYSAYSVNDPEARYMTNAVGNTKMPKAGGTFTGDVSFDDNVIIKGDGTNGSGELTLNCENNSHGVKIKGPPHSAGASYTITLPDSIPGSTSIFSTVTDTAADIPNGTTAERPSSPAAGQFRFNSTDSKFEGYDGTEWGEIGGGGTAIIDGGDFNSASSIAGATQETFNGGEFT